VDGKAECGQLNLAHLTETPSCRYICYSSVVHWSGVLVVHSLSSESTTETPSMSSVSWHLCCCHSPQGTCDIQTNNYSENDKEPC